MSDVITGGHITGVTTLLPGVTITIVIHNNVTSVIHGNVTSVTPDGVTSVTFLFKRAFSL